VILAAVGVATAGVLTMIAVVHVYWAFGGRRGAGRAVPERSGAPLFTPTRGATLTVAALVLAAALLVVGRVCYRGDLVPSWALATAVASVGVVFALRAVGDFRWVGFFKRHRTSPFARRDTWLYSPLCAALAAGCLLLAWG
jgi:hypothetical protein